MSQGLLDIRRGHVAKDVSGRCIREEKPSISNRFKLLQSGNSKRVIQEEQRDRKNLEEGKYDGGE